MKITNDNFKSEVLESDIPVLLDFWAEWCGPCRMLGPVLEKLSDTMPEVKFCKSNVDEDREHAVQMGITNIPAVYVFKNGKAVGKHIGFAPDAAAAITALVEKAKAE